MPTGDKVEKITVKLDNTEDCRSVLEALQRRGIDLNVNCAGMGRCGKCKVRFVKNPPAPSNTDKNRFTEYEIEEGIRLVCTARPQDGMIIEI